LQRRTSGAPQGRNKHVRAEQIGRFRTNYIKLHVKLNVKRWIFLKFEVVRTILAFRRENPHRLEPSAVVLSVEFSGLFVFLRVS
jgi:hypothetical protein